MTQEQGWALALAAVLAQDNPLKRFASVDEIAQAILYLASNAASFMTASDFVINGGYAA